jgi:DNA-binding Xre family transcriptional regulator
MIAVNIKEAAKRKNIDSSYKLQKITGFDISMAARIWRGKWVQIHLRTLNTLCSALECTPNDILQFTPDRDDH